MLRQPRNTAEVTSHGLDGSRENKKEKRPIRSRFSQQCKLRKNEAANVVFLNVLHFPFQYWRKGSKCSPKKTHPSPHWEFLVGLHPAPAPSPSMGILGGSPPRPHPQPLNGDSRWGSTPEQYNTEYIPTVFQAPNGESCVLECGNQGSIWGSLFSPSVCVVQTLNTDYTKPLSLLSPLTFLEKPHLLFRAFWAQMDS